MTRILRSGWLPALAVLALAVLFVHRGAEVGLRDIVAFLGYLAGWVVLPGTLCWRAVTARRGPRPLAEDLALGALVGYVLEFPVYLAFLWLGHPHAYLLWPALAVAATLVTPRGRALWKPTRMPMPTSWSWSVSAVMAYVVVWFAHNTWGPAPVTGASLSTSYVDEPYHLSLAASLRHSLPPKVLFVDDTPLKYHWLSHLHVAASSWVTGIEPVVLLRTLALPALVILVAVAVAHMAVRLTDAPWTGIVVAGALVVAPMNYSGWGDGGGERLLATRLLSSPSASFVNAALMITVLLCIELLRGKLSGVAVWALTGLGMVAMLGAKSTSLPTVMAGLIVATAVVSLVDRRLHRVGTGLSVLAVVAFFGASPFFFGAGTHGLNVDLFEYAAHGQDLPMPVAGLASFAFLAYLSTGAGALALLLRRGYREPDHVFLLVTCLAGLGAALVFHQQAFSEYYFIYVVLMPMMLAGVLGLHHLVGALPGRPVLRAGAAGFVLAAVAGLVLIKVDHGSLPGTQSGSALWRVTQYTLLPMGVTLLLALAATAAVMAVVARQPGRLPYLGVAVLVLACAGLGTAPTLRTVPDLVSDPIGAVPPAGVTWIAPGGLAAAHWLRDHTGTDTLVATNAHCARPRVKQCVARNFWMAGYSERQFLVEGWSYVSWDTVGLTSPTPDNTTSGPFWAPKRLADNDAAFTEPSGETLGKLHDTYGVRYLLVDERYPVDLTALEGQTDVRFESGRYVVLELR